MASAPSDGSRNCVESPGAGAGQTRPRADTGVMGGLPLGGFLPWASDLVGLSRPLLASLSARPTHMAARTIPRTHWPRTLKTRKIVELVLAPGQ